MKIEINEILLGFPSWEIEPSGEKVRVDIWKILFLIIAIFRSYTFPWRLAVAVPSIYHDQEDEVAVSVFDRAFSCWTVKVRGGRVFGCRKSTVDRSSE